MQVGQTIYFDYQASTPLAPEVSAAMQRVRLNSFANPHSTQHILGRQSASEIDQARKNIEDVISAAPEEIIFTSGATEANNQAIASVMFGNTSGRKKVLISAIEHKCIKNAAYFYAQKLGCVVEEIPVLASGIIDMQAYKSMLSEQVLLVCIMAVNNEIGTIQHVSKLASLAHDFGALFHCDAAQAPEAIDIDVKAWNVDMLSLSAHKIYGPKGIGALFMKNSLQAELPPLINGGGQQAGMRSGTLPTELCVGFATALTLCKQWAKDRRPRLKELRDYFVTELTESDIDFQINGHVHYRHPGNLNIQLPGCNASELLTTMEPYVCATTGSACNSEMLFPSHVLKSIGLSDEEATSSIRFSLGRYTSYAQIDAIVEKLSVSIKSLCV
jgi:cysteine desulfurase